MTETKQEEKKTTKHNEEFKKGFDDGFHKGIVQGYIKGHTDASEDFSKTREKNFMLKIIEVISRSLKENVFSNTPIQALLNAIKSLMKNISNISLPNISLPNISLSLPKKEAQPVLATV